MNEPQPAPERNEHVEVWSLVISDAEERNALGILKYGTPLQPFNGRDALVDAYQESLDQVVYLRQEMYERDWRRQHCAGCARELSSQAGPLCLACMIERVRAAGYEVKA